jgi:GGDEF domain-containing protein
MLLGKKMGASPKIQRRQLTSVPTIDMFTAYLRELMAAPPGVQFEVSWEDREQVYNMAMNFNPGKNVAAWRLYAGEGPLTRLILEQETNNVSTLYNLVNSVTGKDENVSDDQRKGFWTDQLNGEQDEEQEQEQDGESKGGNFVLRNLQKLLNEAREDLDQTDLTSSSSKLKTLELSQIKQNSGLKGVTPTTKANEFFGPKAVPATVEISKAPADSGYVVDLTRGRGLLQSLLHNELGIMSYPAFLFLMEQEFYKSLANSTHMTVALLKIVGVARQDGTCYHGALPKNAIRDALHWLKSKVRKTDIVAQYENNCFVFLLPETDANGAKTFAKKVERFFSKPEVMPGQGNAGVKVCLGLATLGSNLRTLPVLLAAAEQSLFAAMRGDGTIVSFEEYQQAAYGNGGVSAPPFKGVNLDPMHQLMRQLRAEDQGIFTYAAWLVFLEREFNRAQRQKRVLFTLLLRFRINDISSDHPEAMLPKAAVSAAFRRIEHLQKKGDIVGHFVNGNYAIIRPNASVKALDALAKQITISLMERPLAPGYDHNALKIGTQIDVIRRDSKTSDSLTFQPANRNHQAR